jgi:hypothetical protein
MTVLPLVVGAIVVACSGGSTPVDPAASSARDVHGAIGVDTSSGGASPASAPAAKDRRVEAWRRVVAKTPALKEGCFTVTYPSTTWTEEPCAPAVSNPLPAPPRQLVRGAAAGVPAVGRGTDWFAQTSSATTSATGSFPFVSGVSTVSSSDGANAYSLQLNTNAFSSSACNGVPTCRAAMQAVFYGQSGNADIWYVLLNYYSGSTVNCPSSSWIGLGGTCYLEESRYQVNIGAQPVSNLGALLLGAVTGSTNVTMTISAGGSTAKSIGVPNLIGLGSGWTDTEFNIFGDGGSDDADFAGTPTIQVQTDVEGAAPSCSMTSNVFTLETNSLNLVPNCCLASANGITFLESGVTGQSCTLCGAQGQTCCTNGWCASSSEHCSTSGTCTQCGGANEPCCAGSTCNSGLACYPTTPGSSETSCLPNPPPACGGRGQTCCDGSRCDTGLACKAVSVTVDGHRLTAFKCE